MARCRPRRRYHRALQRLARYRADAAWYHPRPDDLFLRSLGQPQRGVRWRGYPLSRSSDPGVDRGRNGQGHLLLPEGAQRPLSRRGDLRPRRGLQSLFDVIASGARNLLQMETPFHGDVSALDMTDWTANQNKKAEDRSPALVYSWRNGGGLRSPCHRLVLRPLGLLQRLIGLDAPHHRAQPGIFDDRRVERRKPIGECLAVNIAHDLGACLLDRPLGGGLVVVPQPAHEGNGSPGG